MSIQRHTFDEQEKLLKLEKEKQQFKKEQYYPLIFLFLLFVSGLVIYVVVR